MGDFIKFMILKNKNLNIYCSKCWCVVFNRMFFGIINVCWICIWFYDLIKEIWCKMIYLDNWFECYFNLIGIIFV